MFQPIARGVNTAECWQVNAPFRIIFKSTKESIIDRPGSYIKDTPTMPEGSLKLVVMVDGKATESILLTCLIKCILDRNGNVFWQHNE